jgi:RimJ/RimL family protein N-acetyltransferase
VNWEPHVLEFLLKQFEEHPEQVGWHRHVGLREADGGRTLVGSLGAFSTAERPWECEVGYGILPEWEGRGLATEGTRALIEALRGEGIRSVIAHTYPHLTRSLRVMEKCGMRFDGDGAEAGTVRYRVDFEVLNP